MKALLITNGCKIESYILAENKSFYILY